MPNTTLEFKELRVNPKHSSLQSGKYSSHEELIKLLKERWLMVSYVSVDGIIYYILGREIVTKGK